MARSGGLGGLGSVFLAAIGVAVVLGMGALVVNQSGLAIIPSGSQAAKTDIAHLQVGDCLRFVAEAGQVPAATGDSEISHLAIDCDDAGFKFQVAAVGQDCPNEWYWRYYQPDLFSDNLKYDFCLAPVFAEDTCYVKDDIEVWRESDCPQASFYVQQIVANKDECSRSGSAIELELPNPGKVVCAVKP